MSVLYTIGRLVLGSYQATCHLLTSGGETLVIDPGAEPEVLLPAVEGLNIVGIVATHCHSDHIGAINELAAHTGAPVMAGRHDVAAMADPHLSGFDEEGSDYRVEKVDVALSDGQVIEWGEDRLVVLETPGHTPGSICLLDESAGRLFSGDTLFLGGYGNTGFIRGDARQMRATMRRLGTLDPAVVVFPGHGPTTTIGAEAALDPQMRSRQ